MSNIYLKKYNEKSENLLQNNKCGICLNIINCVIDNYIVETCNHNFHTTCFYRWFIINNTCPICRVVENNSLTIIITNINKINNDIVKFKTELIKVEMSYAEKIKIYNDEIEQNKILLKKYIKDINTTDNTKLKINFNNIYFYNKINDLYNNIFIIDNNLRNKTYELNQKIHLLKNRLKIINMQNDFYLFCIINKNNVLSSNITF